MKHTYVHESKSADAQNIQKTFTNYLPPTGGDRDRERGSQRKEISKYIKQSPFIHHQGGMNYHQRRDIT